MTMIQWKNSENFYGVTARAFHWSVGLLILGLLGMGFYMSLAAEPPFKFKLYGWHKSFGMLVLGLVVLRVMWRGFNTPPAHLTNHKPWERHLSRFIHGVLYISMVCMPLSGWLMSDSGGYPVKFFGLFEFPSVIGKNESVNDIMGLAHEVFAYALVVSVGLHIVGALKHHFIDRDETLKRMGGHLIVGVLGLAILLYASFLVLQDVVSKARVETVQVLDDDNP